MNLEDFGFGAIDHERLMGLQKPYKIYAQLLDPVSLEQFFDVLSQPFVTYGALMPDAHAGYTMPIGGVCATRDVVVPQFVGFDIGCGMCAYKTEFDKDEIEANAEIIYNHIIDRIPLGFNTHKNHQKVAIELPLSQFAEHILETTGRKQLGTLGGGNHFIEVGYGADGKGWIVIHSGSRGFGHKIASHYMLQAFLLQNPQEGRLERIVEDFANRNKNLAEHNPEAYAKALQKFTLKTQLELDKKIKVDNIKGIYGLHVESELGKEYIKDQNFALAFALENRKKMIETIHTIMNEVMGGDHPFEETNDHKFINRNHNHAEFSPNRGEWIHRKGATHAEDGMSGVIPGNMRDGSFIVRGKGNPDSLASSSHGAGRVMSRTKAKGSVSMEEFEASMKGITGTIDENTLDESPFAYKDIFEVMELQKDLVDVVEHIKVLINVKDNSKLRY